MYPLKLVCKQYTNQFIWNFVGGNFSLPAPVATRTSPAAGFQAGALGDPIRGSRKEPAAVLLWSRAATPSSGALTVKAGFWEGSQLRGPLPPSQVSLMVSLVSLMAGSLPPNLSMQEATCIPSIPSQSHDSLRDPSPCPITSHPITETKWRNNQSQVYWNVYKDDLRSHKIKMGEGPGGKKRLQSILEDSVQPWRWLTLDPQQSISRPARSLSSSASRLWRSGQPRLGEKEGHDGHRWAKQFHFCPWTPTSCTLGPSVSEDRQGFICPSIHPSHSHPLDIGERRAIFLAEAMLSLGTKTKRPNPHSLVQVHRT